jgi:hypothetical protein
LKTSIEALRYIRQIARAELTLHPSGTVNDVFHGRLDSALFSHVDKACGLPNKDRFPWDDLPSTVTFRLEWTMTFKPIVDGSQNKTLVCQNALLRYSS